MADRLGRHQMVVIELSLRILRDALDRSTREPVNTIPVRLALRCLLNHCPERWPLTNFWDSASQVAEWEYEHIGRSQGCTAAFNGICRQLRLAGRYPEGVAD